MKTGALAQYDCQREETRIQALMILPVSPGRWQDRFGGGRENADIQPPLVDILVPKGGRTQEEVLSDYDPRARRPVKITGVVPAEQK